VSEKKNSIYPDKYHLAKGPTYINVETTMRCNLKCKMCGHSSFAVPPQADISMEAIANLRPILTSADTIWLSGFGEPLMHPHLFDIIAEVKACNPSARTGFTTNATLLSRRSAIERLIESNLDRIQVSFEGYDNDFGHQQAARTMRNLRALRDRKTALGVHHPQIEFMTVLMKNNINQLKEIIDEALDVGSELIAFQPLRVDAFSTNSAQHAEQDVYANKALALPLIQEAVEYGRSRNLEVVQQFMDENLVVKRRKCSFPFESFFVAYDGSVHMCCNGQATGENLNRKDAWEIWNGEAYRKLRYMVDTENYDRKCWECSLFQPPVEDEEVLRRELSLLSVDELVDDIVLHKRYIREAHRQYDAQEGLIASQQRQTMELPSTPQQKLSNSFVGRWLRRIAKHDPMKPSHTSNST
jgi:MoaA/NifB/PqqE/SkfB family radical SAM enzyme